MHVTFITFIFIKTQIVVSRGVPQGSVLETNVFICNFSLIILSKKKEHPVSVHAFVTSRTTFL